MRMSRVLWAGLIVVLLLGAGLWISGLVPHCCGARQTPSTAEAALARRFRSWSLPSGAKQRRNPFTSSPEVLQESARHFADHCASCHGNDGSGNTEIGRNLYPPAPDMRLPLRSNSAMASSTTSFTTGFAGPACRHGANPAMTTTRTAGSWCCSSATCRV